MLRTLYIQNIVLIKELLIDFKTGLSVFTGETGAGKSILLDALSLTLGARSGLKLIKKGEKQGTVIATFEIEENSAAALFLREVGINVEKTEPLILKRIVTDEGTSRAFVNDQPVTVSYLKRLSQHLIEIHGQFDQLLDAHNHRDFLDKYAKLSRETKNVEELYTSWQTLKKEHQDLLSTASQERLTLLEHYIDEFQVLEPRSDEEETLQTERSRLLNADKIKNASQEILLHLSDTSHSAESSLIKAEQSCETAANYDEKFHTYLETLASALIQVQEVSRDISQLLQEDKTDSGALELIENRLSALKSLSRKHNCSIKQLPDIHQKLLQELYDIQNKDESLKKLEKKCNDIKNIYYEESKKLSCLRKKAAKSLEKKVSLEMPALKMDRALFQICQKDLTEENWGPFGIDAISFEVSPNGTSFGSLKEIASGGERSRIMLALKVVLTSQNDKKSIVFDEIDSGVGGAVATSIGQRLYNLGSSLQVFSITHAPQIAAFAKSHYKVEKMLDKKSASYTTVQQLTKEGSEEEIARMLSGQTITTQAREAAKDLRNRCGK